MASFLDALKAAIGQQNSQQPQNVNQPQALWSDTQNISPYQAHQQGVSALTGETLPTRNQPSSGNYTTPQSGQASQGSAQIVLPQSASKSSSRATPEELAAAFNRTGKLLHGGAVMPDPGSLADILKLQKEIADNNYNRTGMFDNSDLRGLSPDQLKQVEGSANDFLNNRLQGAADAYDARKKEEVSATKGSSVSEHALDNERALLSMYTSQPIVKDYNTVITSKLGIDNILKSGVGGAQDLATVYSFMKALDPGSVVRESEYATAANSGNIFTGALARFNGLMNPSGGFISPQLKKEFQNIVNSKMKSQQSQYDNYRKQVRDIAERQGLNPDNVTIDFTGGFDNYNDNSTGDYKFVNGKWQ